MNKRYGPDFTGRPLIPEWTEDTRLVSNISKNTRLHRMKDNRLLNRFKTEYDFKTFVTSFISLVVTVIFAVYNGFLGIYHASLWHGTLENRFMGFTSA